jgi:HSP90 family molecular chaperone
VSNLGTIARSGSKAFMKDIAAKGGKGIDTSNIIGQFGVGFYSAFMVGDSIDVYSQSAAAGEDKSHYWTSDGTGSYELSEIERQPRGTRVVIHLKKNAHEFTTQANIEQIIKKYSNFVGFPIYLNGVKLNTIGAIWSQSKDSITEEQYLEFYKYSFNQTYDTPFYRLHFNTDAPISINALFYFPERHMEKYGMGRLEPGVNLYSRKVLIKAKSKEILPDWLRFVRGVVDSEDIPLNISRENMQDSRLITKISNVLVRRIVTKQTNIRIC